MERTPRAVIAIVVAMACVPVLQQAWMTYWPPWDAVPTGLSTGDSGHHLVAARAAATGFHSPFAACRGELGAHSRRYFAPPIFLLSAAVGAIGLGSPMGMALANGLGGAFYLAMVWRFLRRNVPALAPRAFCLFALGGGLGGAAYLAALAAGWAASPDFERQFQRFAWYELIEGQHLAPLLLFPRLYYTLPLGLAFAALSARRRMRAAAVCAALAALINVRLAPIFIAIALLRGRGAAPLCAGLAAGGAAGALLIGLHPSYAENVRGVTQEAMRLLPFLSQGVFVLPLAALGAWHALRGARGGARASAMALAGFLAAYAAAYFAHVAYHGAWLYGGETRGAAAMATQFAACGLLPGIAIARLGRKRPGGGAAAPALLPRWIAWWGLGALAAALCAWPAAWLALAPQRFMVAIAVPMAIAAAAGLERLPPRAARGALALVLACGVLSNAVGAVFFQGPLGGPPGRGAFAYLRYGLMPREDAALMAALPAGTVLVPGWSPIAFGEILAQRPGVQPIGGPGALNLGDRPFGVVQAGVAAFFDPATDDMQRRGIAARWCAEYVYCPAMCPQPAGLLAALDAAPWLEPVARAGAGAVYRVRGDGAP